MFKSNSRFHFDLLLENPNYIPSHPLYPQLTPTFNPQPTSSLCPSYSGREFSEFPSYPRSARVCAGNCEPKCLPGRTRDAGDVLGNSVTVLCHSPPIVTIQRQSPQTSSLAKNLVFGFPSAFSDMESETFVVTIKRCF